MGPNYPASTKIKAAEFIFTVKWKQVGRLHLMKQTPSIILLFFRKS